MNNLVVFPIIVPLLTGIFLFFLRKRIFLQKLISAAALSAVIIISAFLVQCRSALRL